MAANDLEGAYIAADVVDMSTGEVLIDANRNSPPPSFSKLIESGIEASKSSSRSATTSAP